MVPLPTSMMGFAEAKGAHWNVRVWQGRIGARLQSWLWWYHHAYFQVDQTGSNAARLGLNVAYGCTYQFCACESHLGGVYV